MLNYDILDRKRKVTLQHFDLFWRGTAGGGRRCVCVGEKYPRCPLFLSCSHCLLFLILVYPVAWQADGSDYTVIINHGRKPWERRRDDRGGEEEEKGRSSERSRASTRVDRAHGSAPVLISITLTAQTYMKPPGKNSGISPLHPRYAVPFPQMWDLWSQFD